MSRAELERGVVNGMTSAVCNVMRWGTDDCALWFANIIRDTLGYDPAQEYRGHYSTRRGAMRLLGRKGLMGAVKRAARRHHWKKIKYPALAQPGDIGLAFVAVELPNREIISVLATVICRAPGWFVGRSLKGYTAIPACAVTVAWSVLDDRRKAEPGQRAPAMRPYAPARAPEYAAAHDPISAAIGLTALIESIGFSAAVAGAIGGFIIASGVSVAFSLAASLLQPHKGTGALDNTISDSSDVGQPVQITERQSIAPKRVIFGTQYVGGVLFFEQVLPPFLYQGILINHGEIAGIQSIAIGTDTLVFTATTPTLPENTIMNPLPITGQASYNTHLSVSLRYGSDTQLIDPILFQNFGALFGNQIQSSVLAIGDMTSNGGVASAYNGTPVKTLSASSAKVGTSNISASNGQAWGAPVTVGRFNVQAPSDVGFSTSANKTVTFLLEGSTDNFATSIVLLYTVPGAIYAANAVIDESTGIDVSTPYPFHRIRIVESAGDAGSHTVGISEINFYSALNAGFRQRGIATAVFKYNYGTDANDFLATWGQVSRPSAYFIVSGVVVYDPRDPTQNLNDETTWKWSNNASLVQATYLTRDWGGRIDKSKILWDKVADSPNFDDDLIACADGTFIKRYTIDGVVTLNTKPYQVLPDLLSANRALVLESGGYTWISSARPRTPIATIYDGILSGAITYQAAKVKRDLINDLQVTFVASEQDYQVVNGPVLLREDLVALDGEDLPATLALNYTQDYRRAERLQKAFLESSRLGRTITCGVTTEILANADDELIGNAVNFDSVLFPQMNGLYLVTGVGFADDFSTVSLALTEYDPTIETDWNCITDEMPFVLAPLATS